MVWSHIPEVDGGDATTPGRKIGVAVSPAAIVVVLKWKIIIEKKSLINNILSCEAR